MNLSFPAASFPFTKASWIWAPNAEPTDYAVCRFRTRLRLGEAHTLRLSVSADSRYLLYWDGRPLGRGPARSDLRHYVYETYTVEADAGTHTLAAIVQSYRGAPSPIAEMHDQSVFLLEACDAAGQVVCATGTQSLGDGWRVQKDAAYRPAPVTMQDGYYGIGASEIVDGMRLPHGWEQPGFADAHWETPAVLFQAYPFEYSSDMADPGGRWRLIPRDIPPLREDAAVFADWPGTRAAPVIIPAQSRRTILVSAGDYALGYPVVTLEGGRGASVEIVYAEALTKEIFGPEMGFLPWQRPGFDLGLKLGEMATAYPEYVGVVLGGHGLFTWAETARECYRQTLRIIDKASAWLAARNTQPVFGGAQTMPCPHRAAPKSPANL